MKIFAFVFFGLFFLPQTGFGKRLGMEAVWMIDIDAAQNLAKKTKKPMLIDFYGIWCPPCNELDETVFNTPAFLAKSQAFVRLRVDADNPDSWKLKDRYKIGGYPTILFTDSAGEEVFRVVGGREVKEMIRAMDLALNQKGKPFAQACRSKAVADLYRCALVCSEREDEAGAKKAFAALENKLPAGSLKDLRARTYVCDHESPDLKRAGFLSLMKNYPSSSLALYWTGEYLATFGPNDTRAAIAPDIKVVENVLKNFPAMIKNPDREEFGIAETDFPQMKAQVLDRMGNHEEAKLAWKEAAELFEKKKASLPVDVSRRGYVLEQIPCWELSGDFPKAMALATEFRSKYPEEFTFYFLSAGLLERQKNFPEALPLAKRAYELAYGDNKIRSATLLVKILGTQSNTAEAKKVVDEIKASFKPDEKLAVRTHRYLKALDEMSPKK